MHCHYKVHWTHENGQVTNFWTFDKLNNRDLPGCVMYIKSERSATELNKRGDLVYKDTNGGLEIYRNYRWQCIVKAFEKWSTKPDFTLRYFDDKSVNKA